MTDPAIDIACVGAGPVGLSWSRLFRHCGHRVTLIDIDRDRLATASAGDLPPDIRLSADIGTAANAHFVFEAIAEDLATKRAFFDELADVVGSHCLIASSSSGLPISASISETLAERSLVAHPLNPPELIRVVEVCPGPATLPETTSVVVDLLRACGRRPILMSQEIDGFVANRLALALYREALHLIGAGIVTPADLDTLVRDGLARRWAIAGPSATYHLNQTDSFGRYFQRIRNHLEYVVSSLASEPALDREGLDRVIEWRDSTLEPAQVPESLKHRNRLLEQLDALLTPSEPDGQRTDRDGTGH